MPTAASGLLPRLTLRGSAHRQHTGRRRRVGQDRRRPRRPQDGHGADARDRYKRNVSDDQEQEEAEEALDSQDLLLNVRCSQGRAGTLPPGSVASFSARAWSPERRQPQQVARGHRHRHRPDARDERRRHLQH